MTVPNEDPGLGLVGGTSRSPECDATKPGTNKRVPLGHCEPVMLMTPPNTVEPQMQETAEFCNQLQDVNTTGRINLHDAEIQELEDLIV
jgi:hypothetical protein